MRFKLFSVPLLLFLTGSNVFADTSDVEASSASTLSNKASDNFLIHRPDILIANLEDPFYSYLIKIEEKNKNAIKKLNESQQRNREPLEYFDLNSLKISGIYKISGRTYATVEDNTGRGYTVTVGEYIGKNNGKIQDIVDNSVIIDEKMLMPTGSLKSIITTLSMHSRN